MTKSLAEFAVLPDGDQYRLRLTMVDGTSMDLLASFDQLDMLAEEIDLRLDMDDAADG